MNISKNEEKIIKILNSEKISFIREKTFSDLKKGKYRFDFYLPQFNICIECDGEQHYNQVKQFQKTRQDFLKQQERDRRKNCYCLSHNISLYRIPYYEIKNVNTFYDIINKKFLVTNKWHNDLLRR